MKAHWAISATSIFLMIGLGACMTSKPIYKGHPRDAQGKPVPYATLNPPPGITPAQTREWFSWSFPEHTVSDPNLPGRLPRQTWTPEARKAYEQKVDWFHQARYGIFFHFLSGGKWTPEEWDKWVEAVDVEKVADQAKELGVGYVIITLGQNQIYSCAPNPLIDELWKTAPGQYTSKRDLPMDLADALEKRGIPMMLYVAADSQYKMPRPAFLKDSDRFDNWIKVCQWYSDHYGTKSKGWWVDGLEEHTKDYRVNICNALKHGNPDALVGSGHYEISDFVHGHCRPEWGRQITVVKPFYGRWDADFGIQWHVLLHVGYSWGRAGCHMGPERLVKYAVDVVRGGGIITFDLGTFSEGGFDGMPKEMPDGLKADGSRIGPFLKIQPDQMEILKSVRDALKAIPASDGSGIAAP